MLKAIIFDLDDTLIDWSGFSRDWEAREREHLQGVFEMVCSEIHPLEDFSILVRRFISRTQQAWENARQNLVAPHVGRVMVETLAELGVPAEALNERRCLEAYGWGAIPGVTVFPDVPDALELFREQGLRLAIITNAYQPMWMRDIELEEHGLLSYFPDCRFSAADLGYLKPHPTVFEHALKCLGAAPEEVVFVGDNPVADIAGAQGAGMQAVLRVTHPTPPMLSGLIVPDCAVNSLAELPDILDQWYPGWRS